MSAILNQDAPAAQVAKNNTDSSHWYACEAGEWLPLYTPEKNYTLREARKDKEAGRVVVPSVTTIFKVLAKPQLEKWKMEQVALAALASPHSPDVSDDDWIEGVIATANNASKGAMDLGTRIHQAIEDCIAGRDYAADLAIYVVPVMAKRAELGIRWSVTEACMGSTKYGYAGRCDDHSEEGMVIRDIKSRKSKGKKVPVYETDPIQLAAYGFAKWGNEFFKSGRGEIWGISTSEPGLLTVHTYTGPELVKAFSVFLALLQTWVYINNFNPAVEQ